jgi:hypothetical protein
MRLLDDHSVGHAGNGPISRAADTAAYPQGGPLVDAVFLTDWSPEARDQYFHEVMRGGWSRIQPPLMSIMLVALAADTKPLTRDQWRSYAAALDNPNGDWDGSCWDPEDGEGAEAEAKRAEAARYAAHFGLARMETIGDTVLLMEAAGLVREIPDADGIGRIHPASPFPFPEELLPLSDEERQIQRELRFEAAYAGASNRIISLFDPDDERLPYIRTNLRRLARAIQETPESARQAVLLLVKNGDFTANAAVADLAEHTVFDLTCDWDAFDTSRIALAFSGYDDEADNPA